VTFKTYVDGVEVLEEDIGMPEVRFDSLDLKPFIVPSMRGYDGVLEVWKKAHHWLGKAKDFFVLEGFVTDHTEIVQSMSRAYKILAYFDKDPSRQCKMHKRRIDLLEPVERSLSADVFLMQSKQLAFELAEIHDHMFEIKSEEDSGESLEDDPKRNRKLLQIATKSIAMLLRFVSRFHKAKETAESAIEADEVEWFLMGHLSLARMYAKALSDDPHFNMQQVKKSLDHYKWILDYVEDNKEICAEKFTEEAQICRDMVELLPEKLDKMASMMD